MAESEFPKVSLDEMLPNDGYKDKSKFEVFFEAPYSEIKQAMGRFIKPNSKIIDLGCSIGNLEDYLETSGNDYQVKCIDLDEDALRKLSEKDYKHINKEITLSDANEYLAKIEGGHDQDVILLNATLHEINDPANQEQYFIHFLNRASELLNANGSIIIGDYYYPDEVTDEEVDRFIEYQKKAINHADARNKFVKPELIRQIAEEHGFSVEFEKEIRAVQEIDRRFYVIVLRRKADN